MIEYSVIGLIVDVPGQYDADVVEIVPPVYLPGWYVNATTLPEGWESYQVFPENPVRVYSGDVVTFFFDFKSEEEWLAVESALLEEEAERQRPIVQ